MSRYQIRMQNGILDDLMETLSRKAWTVLEPYMDFSLMHGRTQKNFHHAIRRAFLPYVHAYKLCGLSNICLDQVTEAPLEPETRLLDVNPWDNIYHLFIRGDLNEFVDGLAFEAVESIVQHLKSGTRRKAFEEVQVTFQKLLAEHLFYNTVCGKTELCVYSGSAPVNPWKQ